MATAKRGERNVPLEIRATITERPAELTSVVAYAFSKGGTLLDMQPLDKGGSAKLALPVGKEAQAVRVVLGPEMDKGDLDVGELLRRGGLDAHVALRPNMERLPPLQFEVGPDAWRHWIGRRCLVKGTLLKSVVAGGITLKLPVCNAAIDIYEVDPWPLIIIKLPEYEIDRLRDIVVGPWPPIDLPVPPRPPERFPGAFRVDLAGEVSLNPQPLPPKQSYVMLNPQPIPPGEINALNPQPIPPKEAFGFR